MVRMMLNAARPDGQLRATVSILAVLQHHLSRDHGPGAVPSPTTAAEHAEALPRRWLPLGAGTVRGGDDGTGPEHALRAAASVATRCRTGGTRRAILSMAPGSRHLSFGNTALAMAMTLGLIEPTVRPVGTLI